MCPGCGGSTNALQAFCGWCGLKLNPWSDATPAHDERIAGERKYVTILFADIVGSTAAISGLDPEQSASIFDPVLREMAAIVAQRAGFVTRLTGDGIKAAFGIPAAREDHAQRACAAALAIRAMARSRRLRVRIGINSGEVVVRLLQPGIPGDYDAVGMVVHLAARLEQLARPGSIYLSATTARLVADHFTLHAVGSGVAKGVSGAIKLFELVSDGNRRTRGGLRARDGLTEFVGRDAELATLLTMIGEGGQVVAVLGEPGAGKSRLIFELLRCRKIARWTVMTVEVEADDGRAGLRPFARMLRGWLRVGRHDLPAHIRAKLDARLGELSGLSDTEATALHTLLDLPGKAVDGGAPQSAIMGALRRLIARCAIDGAVLLVVEDVHWLDEEGAQVAPPAGCRCRRKSAGHCADFAPGQPVTGTRAAQHRPGTPLGN